MTRSQAFRFNYRLLFRLLGGVLLLLAGALLLPVVASLYYRDGAQFDLLFSALVVCAAGLLLRNILGRHAENYLAERESLWVTGLLWLVVPLAGAVPYLFTNSVSGFTDAVFESVSGFTTTGSSVLAERLDTLPQGVLLWRSLTQWVGGMGLVMFVVGMLRRLHVTGVQLYASEFAANMQRKLHPHVASSVNRLWRVYLLSTVLLCVLLLLCGNDLLESFCLAFSTVSTGGFLPTTAGLVGSSTSTLIVLTCFMLLSGVNIALLYLGLVGERGALWRDEEFRVYMGVYFGVVLLSVLCLALRGGVPDRALSYAMFHVASAMSTTGFTLPWQGAWPQLLSVVTFLLILVGATSGSTGGGLKWSRVIVLIKYVRNYFVGMLHPRAVRTVTLNRVVLPPEAVSRILAFVFLYIFFIVGGAFVLTICGCSIPSAFGVAVANLSNLGPSPLLGEVGASVHYATLPVAGKWALIALMLVGRVEIFAFVAMLSPYYWRRR